MTLKIPSFLEHNVAVDRTVERIRRDLTPHFRYSRFKKMRRNVISCT